MKIKLDENLPARLLPILKNQPTMFTPSSTND
jgi:predicted nuclease of predicted toxin-antitoxin system